MYFTRGGVDDAKVKLVQHLAVICGKVITQAGSEKSSKEAAGTNALRAFPSHACGAGPFHSQPWMARVPASLHAALLSALPAEDL